MPPCLADLMLAAQILARERTHDDQLQSGRVCRGDAGVNEAIAEMPPAEWRRHLGVQQRQCRRRTFVLEEARGPLNRQLETVCCGVVHNFGTLHVRHLAGFDERRCDDMLRHEPDLQLVGPDDIRHDQVVGAVVTMFRRQIRHGARLLQHDLVRMQQT